MYGYQPPAARRLAQTPEQYADGGLVARMKSADAGPAAFGSRGLSQLRDMVPQMAAMGYPQQAAAPAPAPAPVSDPRAAQLMAMIPKMEAMGYKQQPQMLARGGMVRGPGTGTSDSISDEAEPGTYIMPADSTAEIGPSALEKMGTVPVRLSDGEFKIPPEKVMAIGEAVLKLMKDATHTPVNGVDGGQTDAEVEDDDDDEKGARGFNPADRMAQMPEQMYADGGMVEDDVTRVGNSYSGGNVGGNITVNGAAPGGTFSMGSPIRSAAPAPQAAAPTNPAPSNPAATPAASATPAATPPAPMGWAERNAQRNLQVTASSIMDSPERRMAQAALAPPPPPPPAPAPAPAPAQPAGALTRAASMSAPAPAVQAMGELPANPNGGQVSAQSMGAADSLARRGAADAMAQMPAPQQTNVQAPIVRHSGNDWQARNDLRNALVSASSITNNGGRFDQTRGRNPAALAYQSALATDNALQASEPGLAAAAMKENSETNRSAMRERGLAAQALASERGAMDRTLIKEQGDNMRTGLTTRATVDAARAKAEAAGNKPLAGPVLKQLQETRDTAATIGNLNSTFKDDFAGKGVLGYGADARLGLSAAVGHDKDAVDWWKNYRKQAELVERHSMFGASLTPGEQESWRSADIGPGMHPDVVKKNLATRAALTSRIFGNTKQDLIDAGHSEERINAIANREAGGASAPQGVGTAPAPAALPPRDKLVAGTSYQTPRGTAVWDGKQFTISD